MEFIETDEDTVMTLLDICCFEHASVKCPHKSSVEALKGFAWGI